MKQQLLEQKLKEIHSLAKVGLGNTNSAPAVLVEILKVVDRE